MTPLPSRMTVEEDGITAASIAEQYVQAAVQPKGPAILPSLHGLLQLQVCPRCCLRFAGVRSGLYAEAAPMQQELLAAVAAALQADDAPPAQERPADEQQPAACKPCPVCLGVLQGTSSSDAAQPAPAALLAAVQASDAGNGMDWSAVASTSAADVATAARQQGHDFSGCFTLDTSVPGATLVRQQAVWHWLRRRPAGKALFSGYSPACDVVDLKEAVRLMLAQPLAEQLQSTPSPDAEMHVGLLWAHPACASEADFLFGSNSSGKHGRGAKRRRGQEQPVQLGRPASELLANAAARMLEAKLGEHVRIPPLPPAAAARLFVRTRREALWVGGLYRKLCRDISNSPFFVNEQRLGRTSVSEEIEALVAPHYRCEAIKFNSAGREDMDVRMLGSGRPFALEIINARAQHPPAQAFAAIQEALLASGVGVEVRKLQALSKDSVQLIRDGEQEKQKSYLARCRLPCAVTPEHLAKINATSGLLLKQTTPARVEHRRAMLVRERLVHSMEATPLDDDPCGLMLGLRTQAGTYIKEFVHGDGGRTLPSLGSLLGCSEPAEILELDVLEVHMDFLP